MKRRPLAVAICCFLGTFAVLSSGIAPCAFAQSNASSQSKGAAPAPSAAYAGSESCKTCHEEVYKSWEKGPHWKQTLKEGGIAKHGCEDCHGAGAAHVADPADTSTLFLFGKASAKDINTRCETCHASGPQQHKAINSLHRQADVSCVSCHSSHHSEGREFLLAESQPQLCVTCHQAQKAQFEMPFHHRVNEGLINCTDCHNPHGTVRPHQVRTSAQQDAVCFKCHADKQGPFVFEHDPVKVEGCESCHVPHGGPNQHMLRLSTVNLLCFQCHTNSTFSAAPSAPSFHNQTTQFQACTLCHTNIHGSNFDPFFFK
jgi:DmsE family decaheme c-type cytochrome